MALFPYLLDVAEHDSGGREHGARARGRVHRQRIRSSDGGQHTGEGGSRVHGEEQMHRYARSARGGASEQPALCEYTGASRVNCVAGAFLRNRPQSPLESSVDSDTLTGRCFNAKFSNNLHS
jgi:hypothetical protein